MPGNSLSSDYVIYCSLIGLSLLVSKGSAICHIHRLYVQLRTQGVAGGSHGCANETEIRSTPAGHLYTTPDTVALGNQALDNVRGDQIAVEDWSRCWMSAATEASSCNVGHTSRGAALARANQKRSELRHSGETWDQCSRSPRSSSSPSHRNV